MYSSINKLTDSLASHLAKTPYTHAMTILMPAILVGKTYCRATPRDLPELTGIIQASANEIIRYQERWHRKTRAPDAEVHFIAFAETHSKLRTERRQPHFHCMMTLLDCTPSDTCQFLKRKISEIAKRRIGAGLNIKISPIQDSEECAFYASKHYFEVEDAPPPFIRAKRLYHVK